MQIRSVRISGATSVAFLALLVGAGCTPYGFSSGGLGLDRSLRTVAVLPFENKTTTPGLEREITEVLAGEVRSLGLREVPEARAQVLVSGVIARYEPDIPVALSADPSRGAGNRRKLQIAVDVSIKTPSNGRVVFEKKGIMAEGEYAESAEGTGRRDAILKLVKEIIQGVNSQW